jgi:hypothetical protein
MRPMETIPGIGGGGYMRMMEGVNSTMVYCKNFVNVTMYNSIPSEFISSFPVKWG